jgi:hypothetical protein
VCVSDPCVANYRQATKHDLLADIAAGPERPDIRLRLQRWQDQAVGDIVSTFSIKAHRIRPGLIISADSHVLPTESRELEGRNEIDWIRRGWLDMVFHMDYSSIIQVDQVDQASVQLGGTRKLALLFANHDFIDDNEIARDGRWVAAVVEYAERRWPGIGIGLYLYNDLNAEQQTALGDLMRGKSFGVAGHRLPTQ